MLFISKIYSILAAIVVNCIMRRKTIGSSCYIDTGGGFL